MAQRLAAEVPADDGGDKLLLWSLDSTNGSAIYARTMTLARGRTADWCSGTPLKDESATNFKSASKWKQPGDSSRTAALQTNQLLTFTSDETFVCQEETTRELSPQGDSLQHRRSLHFLYSSRCEEQRRYKPDKQEVGV